MRRGGLWVIALGWLLCASVAGAQEPAGAGDEMARNLFQAGKVAYEAGNYEDALRYFEDSYARSQRPQLLYNIGQAADRMREDDKALSSFRAYLAALPNADNRTEIENRIRALERRQNDAPSALEAAQTVVPAEPATSPAITVTEGDTARDSAPVTSQWWFWTAIGGGVAVAVIAAIALSSGDSVQGPLGSNTGVTAMTLEGAR